MNKSTSFRFLLTLFLCMFSVNVAAKGKLIEVFAVKVPLFKVKDLTMKQSCKKIEAMVQKKGHTEQLKLSINPKNNSSKVSFTVKNNSISAIIKQICLKADLNYELYDKKIINGNSTSWDWNVFKPHKAGSRFFWKI